MFSKIWDTETGTCKQQLRAVSEVQYVVHFYLDGPNSMLVGQGNCHIVKWDMCANQVVQEYNQHQSAIKLLTLFNDNWQFMLNSDDKSMHMWEYRIPVVIKLVANPVMHSVLAVALHLNDKWLAGQSMDNHIVMYSTGDRFKIHLHKEFHGHVMARFACQLVISLDSCVVVSGDAEGSV
ncbi:hypothetical protein IWW55_000605 [Coemansia sp. RSA 2706]|nr:hypothetical protein IWW55_000605 [Coemansia sp. RSA 2706]